MRRPASLFALALAACTRPPNAPPPAESPSPFALFAEGPCPKLEVFGAGEKNFLVYGSYGLDEKGGSGALGAAQSFAELRGTMTELAASNRELDDFAHVASHDLKEPLRGIQSYAQLVSEDYQPLLDQDGKAKLATMERLAQRTTLVGDYKLGRYLDPADGRGGARRRFDD